MELFIPVQHSLLHQDRPIQSLKSLTQRVRAKLADTMEIVTETFDYAQDAFAFVDGVMFADWDAAIGEPEFTIKEKMEYALKEFGFLKCELPDCSVFKPPRSEADQSVVSYRSDTLVVVLIAERSDRGKHINLIARFGELDPRFAMPQFID